MPITSTLPLPVAGHGTGAPIQPSVSATAVHVFSIDSYSQATKMPYGSALPSANFDAGGCSWQVWVYPSGINPMCHGFVSVYLKATDCGDDAVRVNFQSGVVDHSFTPSLHHSMASNVHVFTRSCNTWGFNEFVSHKWLQSMSSILVRNDRLLIQCTVHITDARRLFVAVPPPTLHADIAAFMAAEEAADVTFEVGTDEFHAHKCILAARSPVFKAELFGSMMEKSMTRLHVRDIEPEVFKAFLHYIYTDSLPEISAEETAAMAQHLLVAADRYGLERLKLICQDMLSKCIDIETVMTTLAIAEQHRCLELKKVCFRYIVDHENPNAIIAADSVVKELMVQLVDKLQALQYTPFHPNCRSF